MTQLLIIADDFTGALDTGVQFASRGVETKVVVSSEFRAIDNDSSNQVYIVDAETRHLSKEEAYKVVYKIVTEAVKAGVQYIYKKTDSALRGNIGSELTATYDAVGMDYLSFIPALPKMRRITVGGIHWIDGEPVNESVFGQDPFEPVKHKYVKDIIKEQSNIDVFEVPFGKVSHYKDSKGILVCDSDLDEEILETAKQLKQEGLLGVMAGCSGFATVLPKILELDGNNIGEYKGGEGLLVFCGSVNPITKRQLDYAESNGFTRIRLTSEQKLKPEYWQSDQGIKELDRLIGICLSESRCILDSNDLDDDKLTLDYAKENGISIDEVRVRITKTMGFILKKILEAGLNHTLMVTGGDTLLGFMKEIYINELKVICEMDTGSVMSTFNYNETDFYVISKSGGFGSDELLINLANDLQSKGL